MSSFNRRSSTIWQEQVPGARWYRADLHVHTLDDHPASNFKLPSGIQGEPSSLAIRETYARVLLKQAIENGIEVLGLTPHAVRSGSTDETSATWKIVEVWNTENDDDGIPFRDKIYAVFPGFEPNLADGDAGLHLLFLFDPEIGRDNYLAAFNTVMGGVPPWDNGSLRISTNNADSTFEAIQQLHARLKQSWDYLVLAPHAFGNRGLFSLKSQILEHFPHQHISAIELKDEWLPEDAFADKPWLKEGMKKYRHSFYHSSDAYAVSDIGRRSTLLKLASPRIEALRQALLASDSRLRMTCERNAEGQICFRSDLPEACPGERPWLKSITVSGGTSFFAGIGTPSGEPYSQTFYLNPDLNCLIGGRMSGKSTFLDGLRVWFDHDLPKDPEIRQDVQSRAEKRFLSGDAEIHEVIHTPCNPTAPNNERWPALFYAQRELQKAVRDQETRRQILYRLMPSETEDFVRRDQQLNQLDSTLAQYTDDIESRRREFEEAAEDLRRVETAKAALQRFTEAGIDQLIAAQADAGRLTVVENTLQSIVESVADLDSETDNLSLNGSITNDVINTALTGKTPESSYDNTFAKCKDAIASITDSIYIMKQRIMEAQEVATIHIAKVRAEVQKALIEAGGNAEELNQFDALTELAGEYERVQTQHTKSKQNYLTAYRNFAKAHLKRTELIKKQREAMCRVVETAKERFPDRIRIRVDYDGICDSLEKWLCKLRESGITRWWNNRNAPLSPFHLRRMLNKQQLSSIGMSALVASTFDGLMTSTRRLELASLRNSDRYSIELKIGSGSDDYRDIDELSGGAQVSVLLSLVLETDDNTPLVVDQPEDEMDKAYLFDVLLPALHHLKGRRQVIFATHDANIVVNGDADQVIFLEADFSHGRISEQGAIEEAKVKEAIIKTLDGGRDAFSLRKVKYGF